jgi:hypothetical protein
VLNKTLGVESVHHVEVFIVEMTRESIQNRIFNAHLMVLYVHPSTTLVIFNPIVIYIELPLFVLVGFLITISIISTFFFGSSMGTICVGLGETLAIHKFFLMNQSSILYDKMGRIVAIIVIFL